MNDKEQKIRESENNMDVDKSKKFLKGFGIVSFFILLSRVTGLLREMATAFFLGASYITDALFVGWSIPNTFRRFFAEGLVAPAFVPAFTKAKEKKEEEKAFASVMGQIIIITGILSLLIFILSPVIPHILSPGFSPEGKRLASFFTASLSFYLLFISCATVLSAFLNAFHIFGVPAATMSIFNLAVIIFMLIFSKIKREDLGFVVGVMVGVVIQIIIQIFPILKIIKPKISFNSNEYSKRIWDALLPVIAGGAVYQINFLVSRAIASFGGEKTISFLTYAMRFFEFPLGVFVYSISYVSLPFMAEGGKSRKESFSRAIFFSTAIVIPATAGLILFSKPIIYFVFGYGKFGFEDVIGTAEALVMYSVGLISVAISRIFITDFQASGQLKIPVISGIIAFLVNAVFCLILVEPLKHKGIALASSISSFISMIFLIAKSDNKKIFREVLMGFLVSFPALVIIFISSIFYLPNYLKIPKVSSLLIFLGIVLISSLVLLGSLKKFNKKTLME
jgi:putative peptidoglycan lipid II flippase